ncbi:MAG: TetR/AcrR family transcriptional regulator [Dehalococcoidia bacterium]
MSIRREQTHKKLLEAARDLLEESGLDIRLEDVAKRAGVSRQAVYLHFKSRTGLLVELFELMDSILKYDVGSLIDKTPNGVELLQALVEQRVKYVSKIYPYASQLIANRTGDDVSGRAVYEDRQKARRNDYRLIINQLKNGGFLSDQWDVDDAVEVVRVTLSIPNLQNLVIESGMSQKKYAELMTKTLVGALIHPKKRA